MLTFTKAWTKANHVTRRILPKERNVMMQRLAAHIRRNVDEPLQQATQELWGAPGIVGVRSQLFTIKLRLLSEWKWIIYSCSKRGRAGHSNSQRDSSIASTKRSANSCKSCSSRNVSWLNIQALSIPLRSLLTAHERTLPSHPEILDGHIVKAYLIIQKSKNTQMRTHRGNG